MNGFASAVNHTTTDQLAGDQVEQDEWRHRRRWRSRAVWIGRYASRLLSAMAYRRIAQLPESKCGRGQAPSHIWISVDQIGLILLLGTAI